MLGDQKDIQKNLKDPERKPSASYGAGSLNMSVIGYSKTNKLITALYMVTDIIDKDEPLRNKLRTLGVEILSDINSLSRITLAEMSEKINTVLSFLDIASTINIISEMNSSILKQEFIELDHSIKESIGDIKPLNRKINLSEFFEEAPLLEKEGVGGGNSFITTSPFGHSSSIRRRGDSNGHTRLGVQKGSTLLKAIKDISGVRHPTVAHNNFDILKKQRREEIINFIKKHGESSTITDIKSRAYGSLVSCGEKTLQRELVSMVKDGVLKKTGEKRWSKYFLASSTS